MKRFITKDIPFQEGFIAALRIDGSLECIQKSTFRGEVSWSPDGKWAIPLDYGNELYNDENKKVRRLIDYQVREVIWRSDSAGTILSNREQLLYVDIPNGDLLLVDNRNPAEFSWVGMK